MKRIGEENSEVKVTLRELFVFSTWQLVLFSLTTTQNVHPLKIVLAILYKTV